MIDIAWNILPSGDLEMVWDREKADEEEVAEVANWRESNIPAVFEGYFGNGWDWVYPENVPGALWSGPVIGRDVVKFNDWLTWIRSGDSNLVEAAVDTVGPYETASWLAWRIDLGNQWDTWSHGEQIVHSEGLWTYERYAIEDPMEILYRTGRAVWQKVQED